VLPASAPPAVLQPRDAADRARQQQRIFGLPTGRPVQSRTRSNRGWLSAAFSQWLEEVAGFPLAFLVERKPFDPEELCDWLVAYGRDLYNSGRPYWHYAETVNALTAARPAFRRQAQGAWDLAYTWLAEEPYGHHTAMPLVVLLSILTTCLYWVWVREAGCFALAWGAFLRGGEVCKARRGDLVFPSDSLWSQTFVLLRISEPKTRARAARHQSAKLEPCDLILIVRLAFERLPKDAPSGPFLSKLCGSASTRFCQPSILIMVAEERSHLIWDLCGLAVPLFCCRYPKIPNLCDAEGVGCRCELWKYIFRRFLLRPLLPTCRRRQDARSKEQPLSSRALWTRSASGTQPVCLPRLGLFFGFSFKSGASGILGKLGL